MAFFKTRRDWGTILLAAWLIATGLMSLLEIHFAGDAKILPLVAVAAGLLLLLGR